MAAAVIELDSLPDPVRPAAQNHHLLAIRRRRLAARFVARIQIRREAFELRRARIHAIEHRRDAQLLAPRPHVQRPDFPGPGELRIGDPVALGLQELLARDRAQRDLAHVALQIDHLAHLPQEPRIDRRQRVNLLLGVAALEREADVAQPVRIRRDQPRLDQIVLIRHRLIYHLQLPQEPRIDRRACSSCTALNAKRMYPSLSGSA